MRRSSHQRPSAGKLTMMLGFGALACATAAPPPRPDPSVLVVREPAPERDEPESAPIAATCTPAPRPSRRATAPDAVAVTADDPVAGRFELRDAIEGLSGRWPLTARIHTDRGTLSCELWDEVAPITVANFVGLARGLRPWKRGAEWVTEPAYQGGSFHRVIPGFMIQGGDPFGTGKGEPGYVIPDEIDPSVHADRVGLLYMAHRGRNTGGMQFFVMDGPAPHIDGGYTAFGSCGPEDVIHDIANAPKFGERPEPPVRIRSVEVSLAPGCD